MLRSLILLLSAAALASAGPFLWLDDNAGNIGTIDINDGTVHVVGNAGVTLFDIAFDPSGNLWGTNGVNLFTISQTTGAATLVGAFNGVGNLNALVFSPNGTLYTASSNLYTVNTTTGAAASVGPIGFQSAGDLVFFNGALLMSSNSAQLISVNTTTGAGTPVGPFGVGGVLGLVTFGGDLFGVSGTTIYEINATTGAASPVYDYSGHGLGPAFGLAFPTESQTPEPATISMLGAGLLIGAAARLRRPAKV